MSSFSNTTATALKWLRNMCGGGNYPELGGVPTQGSSSTTYCDNKGKSKPSDSYVITSVSDTELRERLRESS